MADVYVCKESAAFVWNGDMVVVNKDVTRVRAGHPILDMYPELFEEITVHYDVERPAPVERATAAPGEKRSVQVPNELDVLRGQAEELGVPVDKRWGADRIRQEIAKKKAGEVEKKAD
jgi:hypothetical protein